MRRFWCHSSYSRHSEALLKNAGTAVMLTILSGSLALNVYLGWEVASRPAIQRPVIAMGTAIPPVSALSINGGSHMLDLRGKQSTVLYYLSPTCSWCAKNYESIVALAGQASARYRFVGVVAGNDVAAVRRHLAEKPLPFEVYLVQDPGWFRGVGLTGTPTTLALDASARVRGSWVGAFLGDRRRDLETHFKVRFPLLPERSSETTLGGQ
jgi:hypothetical protein